jgi:ABC-type microcin C transport system permease subunit YejB
MKRSLPFMYLGLNIACALVVLFAAHRVGAVIAAEQRDYSDGVDSITFVAMSAPAFLLAMLINVAWAGKAFADAWRRRGYQAFAWFGSATAVWVWTIVVFRLF